MISKFLLFPYYISLKIRHWSYDRKGSKRAHTFDQVPTICVGNIAAGGTGKTPHVEMILRELMDTERFANSQLAVLSLGYKRKSKGYRLVKSNDTASMCGDEPLQIKHKFPDVQVAVDKNRLEGCRLLYDRESSSSDLIILDDAFQYRKLKAKINIVLSNYNQPLDKAELLPMGNLRDLPERIKAADIIIITKCPHYLTDAEKWEALKSVGITSYDLQTCTGTRKDGTSQTVLFSCIDYMPLEPVFPEADMRYAYSKKLVMFTGIATDTSIKHYLSDRFKVVKALSFGDHHAYSTSDVRQICKAAAANPTAAVITTEKDAQRIRDCKNIPDGLRSRLMELPIRVSFLTDEDHEVFRSTLLNLLES